MRTRCRICWRRWSASERFRRGGAKTFEFSSVDWLPYLTNRPLVTCVAAASGDHVGWAILSPAIQGETSHGERISKSQGIRAGGLEKMGTLAIDNHKYARLLAKLLPRVITTEAEH